MKRWGRSLFVDNPYLYSIEKKFYRDVIIPCFGLWTWDRFYCRFSCGLPEK